MGGLQRAYRAGAAEDRGGRAIGGHHGCDAFRVTEATGFYRGPGATITTFMTFGPVTITTSMGASETFTINVTH